MKKFNLLPWLLIVSLFLFSCSEKESYNEEIFETSISNDLRLDLTKCEVEDACGKPGNTLRFTYSSNFIPNNVNWSILNGNISIVAGQGSNEITLSLASNFNGGSVYVIGSGNGGVVCSTQFDITNCATGPGSSCTPPTSMTVSQNYTTATCPGDTFTFYANPNGSTDNGSYQWDTWPRGLDIDGQGTATVEVESPSSGGFSVSVTHKNLCKNKTIKGFKIAEYGNGCGTGGGLSPF